MELSSTPIENVSLAVSISCEVCMTTIHEEVDYDDDDDDDEVEVEDEAENDGDDEVEHDDAVCEFHLQFRIEYISWPLVLL